MGKKANPGTAMAHREMAAEVTLKGHHDPAALGRECYYCHRNISERAETCLIAFGGQPDRYSHAHCTDLAIKRLEKKHQEAIKPFAWEIMDYLGHVARNDDFAGNAAKSLLERISGRKTECQKS